MDTCSILFMHLSWTHSRTKKDISIHAHPSNIPSAHTAAIIRHRARLLSQECVEVLAKKLLVVVIRFETLLKHIVYHIASCCRGIAEALLKLREK